MEENKLKTSIFHFKQFSMSYDSMLGMPISTDGVLLGAWAFSSAPKKIMDIGTGSGLLAIMCAQRFPDATIAALDIDATAYHTASFNCQTSPWKKRISVFHDDILTFSSSQPFDGIICNPPYFKEGMTSSSSQRAIARHSDTLPHQALLIKTKQLLISNGCACFILPKEEGKQFIALSQQQGWYLKRLCHVRPTESKSVHRLLIELSLQPADTNVSSLTIRKLNHNKKSVYSNDFIALTRDFYPKMYK